MARELSVTSVVVTHDMKSAYTVASRIARCLARLRPLLEPDL